MKWKGFTLIEVILAIFLISLLAITFIPMISFGFINTVNAKDFTKTMFDDQQEIENKIEELRNIDPPDTSIIRLYGLDIKGHVISVATSRSGEVNVFIPKKRTSIKVPVIEAAPILTVKKNDSYFTPQPSEISLLDNLFSLYVDEIKITDATKDDYLMSVYRWYMSEEMDKSHFPSTDPNQYFILKEWNAAKKPLSFAESFNLKFIPNIKDGYNVVKFNDAKTKLSLSEEEFIASLGNRYIRYGVTPFSIAGRIGKELLSNPIYIDAPRIEISSAKLDINNSIIITFKEDIGEEIDIYQMKLNESLGTPVSAYRNDENHKQLILEFEDLDTSMIITGNSMAKGAVQSKIYGKISIWYNNIPGGEFDILP